MIFSSCNILLLSVLGMCLVLCALFFFVFRKKKPNAKLKAAESERKKQLEEIDYLNREIKRLNFISVSKQTQGESDKLNSSLPQTSLSEHNSDFNEISGKIVNAEQLNEEKRKFKEKNKKLWEQSIAIHKEKERIDALKKDIEGRHKEVTDSIRYAKRIQTALIPSEAELQNGLDDFFVFWQPRDIVSGDFYWIKSYESKVILVVADCTGHGVPGAFMSALGVAFLNEIVSKNENLKANDILENLRMLVKNSLNQTDSKSESRDGMDMSLCIIDRESRKICFAGANNPLYLYRNSDLIEFQATRNPIGIYRKEQAFESTEINIEENDIFYMMTDGYADEFGGKNGRKFKKAGLKNLILDLNKNNTPLSAQKPIFENTINEWLGEKYEQIDDILLLGFKV